MKELPPKFDMLGQFKIKKDDTIFDASCTPAVIMFNPKYPHNVGAAVRACSCFGVNHLVFTGDRLLDELGEQSKKGYRLPREERMKGYKDVNIYNDQYPFNRFSKDVTPVAVEVRNNSQPLPNFRHPRNPVYVFGPEDGSLPQIYLKHCHMFVIIPSKHCLNLAAAVNIVLYDRVAKSNYTSSDYMKI